MDLHCCQEFAGSNLKAEFRDSFSKSELETGKQCTAFFSGRATTSSRFPRGVKMSLTLAFEFGNTRNFFPWRVVVDSILVLRPYACVVTHSLA